MKKIFLVLMTIAATLSISCAVFAIDDMEMLQRIGDKAYYRDINGNNHTIDLSDFNNDGEINILDALIGVEQLKIKIYEEYSCEIWIPGLIGNNYKVTVSSAGKSFDYQVDKALADGLIEEAKIHKYTFVGRHYTENIGGKECNVNLVCYYITDANSSFIVKIDVPA